LITSIIFSKDRPLQLDLCLKSIGKNFVNCQNKIVIHNNSEVYSQAQQTLEKEHPDCQFWKQGSSLFRDVFAAIASCPDDCVCFFTDDDIFYSRFEITDMGFWNQLVSCMSLRMGTNISERYHDGIRVNSPTPSQFLRLKGYKELIAWDRTQTYYGSYWSYSLSVDGHIFKKDEILQMMDELCFLEEMHIKRGDNRAWCQIGNGHRNEGLSVTPNQLETALQRFWSITSPFIVSPMNSVVVNSPNNSVQSTHSVNANGHQYSADTAELLDSYILGKRIDIDLIDFGQIKCPHTEINIAGAIR
jgi:hypothetical protein